MALNIAVQMDAIESIRFAYDTSFLMMLEAQNRGHKVKYYQPKDMFYQNGKILAKLTDISLKNDEKDYFKLGESGLSDFSEIDVVLMRQDPPFAMNYLTYTYFLEKLPDSVLVINNPKKVRNLPEKLFACMLPEFMVSTCITSALDIATSFYQEHDEIIIKPLYAYAGNDVFYFKKNDSNFPHVFNFICEKYAAPCIVQKFIKEITQGDKRIMLINGEFVGALNRIPAAGKVRSNLVQGGTAVATTLSEREKQICAALSPILKEQQIMVAGIDVIGGYLTEINITSPTGFPGINRLNNCKLEAIFWNEVEKIKGQ